MFQSLFSEFFEGWLPSSRSNEIREHLEVCQECRNFMGGFQTQFKLLDNLARPLVPPSLSVKVVELARRMSRNQKRKNVAIRFLFSAFLPVVLLGGIVYQRYEDEVWKILGRLRSDTFIRYYPMQRGAEFLLKEQSERLHLKDPLMKSIWEEGGLSPEEYESMFSHSSGKSNLSSGKK